MARMSKMDYQMHCRMHLMLNVNVSRYQAKKNNTKQKRITPSKKEYKEMMGINYINNHIICILVKNKLRITSEISYSI